MSATDQSLALRTAMCHGFDAAEVAHAAAAVDRRVAVEDLSPVAAVGHADAIAVARHGREVADATSTGFAVSPGARRKASTLRSASFAVDPLESPPGRQSSSWSAGSSR